MGLRGTLCSLVAASILAAGGTDKAMATDVTGRLQEPSAQQAATSLPYDPPADTTNRGGQKHQAENPSDGAQYAGFRLSEYIGSGRFLMEVGGRYDLTSRYNHGASADFRLGFQPWNRTLVGLEFVYNDGQESGFKDYFELLATVVRKVPISERLSFNPEAVVGARFLSGVPRTGDWQNPSATVHTDNILGGGAALEWFFDNGEGISSLSVGYFIQNNGHQGFRVIIGFYGPKR